MTNRISFTLTILAPVVLFITLFVQIAGAGSLKTDVESFILAENGIHKENNRLPAVTKIHFKKKF